MNLVKIGFGGGCHWCTESVFQSLKGVQKVEQGWIASTNENDSFSEAVLVYFDETTIDIKVLL
jgi:peptide-methionine (S)-S-oxide reductase